MMRRSLQLALLGLLLAVQSLWAPAPVQARPAQSQIEKGTSEFQDLEFAAAIATLEDLLRRGDASKGETLLALELIGISHLSLGNVAESRRAFAKLLALDSAYVLRNHDGSPKVESLFESVRASLPGKSDPPGEKSVPNNAKKSEPATLEPGTGGEAQAGRRYEFAVVSQGAAVKEVVLFWRPGPGGAYQRKAMRLSKGQWRVRLALPASKVDYQLQYYVQAGGVAGQRLAELGNATSPLQLEVDAGNLAVAGGADQESAAWYTRWPVLVGVGAAVVGGSILVFSSGSDPRQGALSPGRITLTP